MADTRPAGLIGRVCDALTSIFGKSEEPAPPPPPPPRPQGGPIAAHTDDIAAVGDIRQAAEHGLAVLRSVSHIGFLGGMTRWLIETGQTKLIGSDLLSKYKLAASMLHESNRQLYGEWTLDIGQKLLDQSELDLGHEFFRCADEIVSTPETRFAVKLLDTFKALRDEAERRAAEAIRTDGAGPHYLISSVVWGDEYCDIYMRYLIRSLLAPGNLPALSGRSVFFSICTTPAGERRIRSNPVFPALAQAAKVNFFHFPEELTTVGDHVSPTSLMYQLYGTMDHVAIFFARALKASMFFFPVDCVVADGSIRNLLKYLDQGYEAIGLTNMVAERERFLPALDARFGKAPTISITPLELATLGYKLRHQYTEVGQIRRRNKDYAKWPREMFWPRKDGLEVRAMFLHPLCVSATALQRELRLNYKWVDFHFTSCLFPTEADFPKFKVLSTSDEIYINDCTTRRRTFPTTGRPFDPATLAFESRHMKPLHRWIMAQPQFIRCKSVGQKSHRDSAADVAAVFEALDRYKTADGGG